MSMVLPSDYAAAKLAAHYAYQRFCEISRKSDRDARLRAMAEWQKAETTLRLLS